jgi:hypothetical protein
MRPTVISNLGDSDLRFIAEQASRESDNAKMLVLVEQLCGAIDARQNQILLSTLIEKARSVF